MYERMSSASTSNGHLLVTQHSNDGQMVLQGSYQADMNAFETMIFLKVSEYMLNNYEGHENCFPSSTKYFFAAIEKQYNSF